MPRHCLVAPEKPFSPYTVSLTYQFSIYLNAQRSQKLVNWGVTIRVINDSY